MTLLFGLAGALGAQPLRISAYTPAGTVNKYLSTPEDRAKAAAVLARFKVTKIWIEGRRGDQYVTPELLKAARDDFRARGLEVSGGLTTVPGKTFGVPSTIGKSWMNYQAEKTQQDIARFYTENAPIFDEIMVDDFYATEDTSPESEKARGNLSWADYRRKLLVSLIDSVMLKPARAARPGTKVIIKFPQWYESFHMRGYDPPGMARVADRIWVGTETRDPKTASYGFVQPTEGYINYRWLASSGREKTGGAWFDFIDCTAQTYLDQAYQSVLAGARELTLFNLGNLMQGHPGQPLLEAALPELFDLAGKVGGREADGVYYYKPPASDSGDNAYVMDYVAMIGVPVVPVAGYPAAARVLMLGRHAHADADLMASVKQHVSRGATLVLTPALVRLQGKALAEMAGVKVSEAGQPAAADSAEVRGQRVKLAPALEIDAGLESPRARVLLSASSGGRPVPLLTTIKAGKGRILVWNTRTFPERAGGAMLAPSELGLPEIPQALADALRAELTAPLKVRLETPAKVGFYMFGKDRAFYNFKNENVTVRLNGRAIQVAANKLLWQAGK